MNKSVLLTTVGGLLCASAAADVLQTTDGRVIEGPTMERGEESLVIHFVNGDIEVPNSMVQEVFIEAELENLPKKEKRRIEKQIAEQREQIEDAMAHSNWGNAYEDVTSNFRWKYTLPEHVAEKFKARLESYYEVFTKEWKVKRDKRKKKLMINFFQDRKEFNRSSGAGGGALAYFMFLGDYDLCCFYDRLDFEFTEMVLYHEASHYLQKLLNEDFKMPHWPGEGLSEYYGGALWDPGKKRLDVGLIQDGRLTAIKTDISNGNYMPVRQTVTTDQYEDYTWGWALVHFFMNTDHKKGFQKYVMGLANDKKVKRESFAFNLKSVTGEESLRYLMACLKLDDDEALGKLEKEFYDYIENDLVIESASGLEKAAKGATQAGRRLRAKRLYKEAEEAGGLSSTGCYQYAKLIRGEDKALARKLYKRATELDPLVGTYWYEYARLIDDDEESERLKLLAKELDPEVGEYDIDFGDFEDEGEGE